MRTESSALSASAGGAVVAGAARVDLMKRPPLFDALPRHVQQPLRSEDGQFRAKPAGKALDDHPRIAATGNTGSPFPEGRAEKYIAQYPLGFGGPQPIADAVRFLLRSSGDWISGAVLNISGGAVRGI